MNKALVLAALIAFLLAAFGLTNISIVQLLPLGLALYVSSKLMA